MLYYRVKKEYDNATRYKWDTRRGRSGYVVSDGVFVGGELYTPCERAKLSNGTWFFEEIRISKNKIYWFFGARFEGEEVKT